MKLNQVIALSKGKKSEAQSTITEAYKKLQKVDLFAGLSRNYTPRDDDGVKYPDENKKVVTTVEDEITSVKEIWCDMLDIVYTQDEANCVAKSNVEVDGNIILKDIPVTTLIFLEKQLIDFITLIGKLPTLDPNDIWIKDDGSGLYNSEVVQTVKTKKVEKPLVLYEATKEHPAQTQIITSDEVVGTWSQKKLSGAVSLKTQNEYKNRALKLREAVIKARENANSINVEEKRIGKTIFEYLFR